MQVTRACTRSHGNIARLAASHAGLYARLTLVIVTPPPRQWAVLKAKRRKCSIDVPVPLQVKNWLFERN